MTSTSRSPWPCIALALLVGLASSLATKAQDAKPAAGYETPEAAVRAFWVALLTGDEAALRATMLPTDEMAWLVGEKSLGMGPMPRERVEPMVRGRPIRILKPGDKATNPDGTRRVVEAGEVDPAHALVVFAPEGFPQDVRRVSDGWRVDPGSVIAYRKHFADLLAADRARGSGPKPGAAKPPAQDDPADAAVRAFLIAVITQDEPKLRAVMLSTEGIEWLLKGQKATGLQAIAVRTGMAGQKFRHLQPGDEFDLPGAGGRKVVVQPAEVSETRAVLMAEGGPMGGGPNTPFRVERVDGTWKVDARPLVAARKGADAARARAAARAKAEAEAEAKGDAQPGPPGSDPRR